MSVMLSDGGLLVGQVVGRSSRCGEEPVDAHYRPENVLAMMYPHLGIDPGHTLVDHRGRPRYPLEETGLVESLI